MNAPIIWFSKKKNTVESSTFGSKFVALRIAQDLIVALRYKLRMFSVLLDKPTDVMCDNQGVVKNTILPQTTLRKKHNAVNYYMVREAAATGILRVVKEDTETNWADLLTNILGWKKRHKLIPNIIYSGSLVVQVTYKPMGFVGTFLTKGFAFSCGHGLSETSCRRAKLLVGVVMEI